ncbi:MAG: (Fe-S)-binding protein [Anaerolineales bacterium]|nr:(Fe-S)-binding protein [Anaerolineales bacterium]
MSLSDHAPVYNLCRFCLMCRHTCPVGRATKREATTPHGWALLISSVDRGQIQWNADTVDTLYQCAQCGLCYANCVTDQPLPSAIAAARAHVAAAGLAPQAVAEVEARLREWGNPFRAEAPRPAAGQAPAALFVGAAAHHLRPAALAAARRLLDALGLAYVPIAQGLSSAYLPFALGLPATARTLGQAALQELAAAGSTRLIVLTPEDRRAFTDALPELGLPLPDGVVVVELMTLLAEAVAAGRLQFRPVTPALTYHDPAHTPHFPGRAAEARRVLAALTPALRELFWREGRAAPGGSVGGLRFTHPALAEQLTRERLAEAAATGAELLVTEDPAALDHFEAQADPAVIRVAGLYELLAQQLV